MRAVRPGMAGAPRVGRFVPPFALNQLKRVVRASAAPTGLAGLPTLTAGPRYSYWIVAGLPPAEVSPTPLAIAATYLA